VAGVSKIDAGPRGAVISFRNDDFKNPSGLVDFLGRQQGTAHLRTDHKLVCRQAWNKAEERVRGLSRVMRDLAAIAA
jgi:transcription-repair coupling factor (superfamily II helicase)